MPTSSGKTVPVPIPEAVVALKARQFPPRVVTALAQVQTTSRNVRTLSRLLATGEMPADARRAMKVRIAEDLGRHAAANKVLAAYNPGLIVTPKQVTR